VIHTSAAHLSSSLTMTATELLSAATTADCN
jgi:hypothetical protein